MENEYLKDLLDFMADRIVELMENECQNSGHNWRQAYEIKMKEALK